MYLKNSAQFYSSYHVAFMGGKMEFDRQVDSLFVTK